MIRMWKKDLVGLVETPGVSGVSKAGPEKKKKKKLGQAGPGQGRPQQPFLLSLTLTCGTKERF